MVMGERVWFRRHHAGCLGGGTKSASDARVSSSVTLRPWTFRRSAVPLLVLVASRSGRVPCAASPLWVFASACTARMRALSARIIGVSVGCQSLAARTPLRPGLTPTGVEPSNERASPGGRHGNFESSDDRDARCARSSGLHSPRVTSPSTHYSFRHCGRGFPHVRLDPHLRVDAKAGWRRVPSSARSRNPYSRGKQAPGDHSPNPTRNCLRSDDLGGRAH